MTALALVALTAAACSSSGGDAIDAGPDSFVPGATFDANVACETAADCETGLVCAYAVADGCSAVGECIYGDCVEDPSCPAVPTAPACGCDGSDVPYVTSTYAAAPVSTGSPCPGGDASVQDATPLDGASDADPVD